jgi:hypothetical protein
MPAAQFSKDPAVDKALRHSVRDGMAFSVQVGAGETYFSAFALFLRATAPQIALLSTLPLLLASSAQIFSAWIGDYVGRRRLVSRCSRGRACSCNSSCSRRRAASPTCTAIA